MNAMDEALRELRQVDGQVTSEIIRDLIDGHAKRRAEMIRLYERYRADACGVPIFQRQVPDYEAINNKLNNDFFSEIIDTKIGYFLGKPIVYDVPNEEGLDAFEEKIQLFRTRNNVEDLDSETGKYAAICGYGARLLYIDQDGQEAAMNLPPWEVIFIYDRSIDEPQYAMRYYKVTVSQDGRKTERWRVEWYDAENVTFYIEDDNGDFVLDDSEEKNPRPHMFDGVPVIEFPNNEERQGDAEKVLSLIDAYDRTLSDVNNEIEAFRLAYMAFYGFVPDKETLEEAKQTGAFGIPNADAGAKIEFITKNLNDTVIENHLNRLEANILRFAKSVNFTDEQFAGNLSGVAMRFKLFALESKCITAERKFSAALRRQFKILSSAWQKKGVPADYTKVKFTFTRNLPVNIMDEAQATALLKGLVSERTRLGLLSFVQDVEAELEQMDREALDLTGGEDDVIPGRGPDGGPADGPDGAGAGEGIPEGA